MCMFQAHPLQGGLRPFNPTFSAIAFTASTRVASKGPSLSPLSFSAYYLLYICSSSAGVYDAMAWLIALFSPSILTADTKAAMESAATIFIILLSYYSLLLISEKSVPFIPLDLGFR